MILKRDWSAGDLGRRAVFANTMKGLLSFVMLDLMEEDVALMYKLDNDLKSALSVTMSDVQAAQAKVQAKVPESPEEFITMLCCYTNLMYALFNSECFLYKELNKMMKTLCTYSPNVLANVSWETKASILWITLLQSRRFAQGKMEGDTPCLGEFTHMRNMISAKVCHQYHMWKSHLASSPPPSRERQNPNTLAEHPTPQTNSKLPGPLLHLPTCQQDGQRIIPQGSTGSPPEATERSRLFRH